MKQLFYNSYMLPFFDYCCTVWRKSAKYRTSILSVFQKRAAHITLEAPSRTSSIEYTKYNLQSSAHYDIINSRFKKKAFSYYRMNIWNEIPFSIRAATSLSINSNSICSVSKILPQQVTHTNYHK